MILADREPSELSHEIRSATSDLHGARLVIRWGDPTKASDLEMVAPRAARSIIVLTGVDDGDGGVVKATLAIAAAIGRFEAVPIIAEVTDPQVAQSLVHAFGPAVSPIITDQAITRVAAYAMRGPGLIQVIRELLDFSGPDLYVRPMPQLAGRAFGEIALGFERARPIGIMSADGIVELVPSPDTPVRRVAPARVHRGGRLAAPTVARTSGGNRGASRHLRWARDSTPAPAARAHRRVEHACRPAPRAARQRRCSWLDRHRSEHDDTRNRLDRRDSSHEQEEAWDRESARWRGSAPTTTP